VTQESQAKVVRFVTTPDCDLVITEAQVTSAALRDFDQLIDELEAQGLSRTDRKYHTWVPTTTYCGIGTVFTDDRAAQTNPNNRGPSYSLTGAACLDYAETHELVHNLGGVQNSAPNATGGLHCRDEYDRLCYADGGPSGGTFIRCPERSSEDLLDCGGDDYYAAAPAPGTYLATHWNVYQSAWLEPATTPTTQPPPTTVPPTTVPPSTTTTLPPGTDSEVDLVVVPKRARVGQTLTLTATVTCRDKPAVGNVEFYLSGRPARLLDSRTLVNGTAELQLTVKAAGKVRLRATHPGGGGCGPDSDSLLRTIAR
jgi:hypothetical protein